MVICCVTVSCRRSWLICICCVIHGTTTLEAIDCVCVRHLRHSIFGLLLLWLHVCSIQTFKLICTTTVNCLDILTTVSSVACSKCSASSLLSPADTRRRKATVRALNETVLVSMWCCVFVNFFNWQQQAKWYYNSTTIEDLYDLYPVAISYENPKWSHEDA